MKMHYRKKVCSCFLAFFMLLPLVTMSRVNAQEAVPGTIVDSNGLKAVMSIDSQWQGFCNGTISITNTGTETIDNFAYSFDFPYEITNIWNAAILEHANGVYTVKNLGWNQDIPAGGTASIGFTAAVDGDVTLPTFFVLNTKEADVAAESAKVEYISYSDWDDGFSGAIRVTNLSSTSIEDYRLSLSFAREIMTISNAVILSHEGSNYTIKNNGSNQNLAPNQTIEIGINGNGGTVTDTITSYSVRQITTRFDLVSDTDGDTYADWLEVCVRGSDPLIPEGITPTPTPTSTPTPTPPDVSPTPIPPIDYETDTDGDGIPNFYEIEIGTDPEKIDTDNDGFTDFEEIYYIGSNPVLSDTDNDGVSDFNEDIDQDGLGSREETEIGTDYYMWDTDGDGLSDGDEVNLCATNPRITDTDSDGLSDGDEIQMNLDPVVADSDGDGIADGLDKLLQVKNQEISEEAAPEVLAVTVSATIAGNIDTAITIENTLGKDASTSDVVGRIGVPVNIECSAEFDETVITFSYDEDALGDTLEEDLAMMWYDEANDEYIVLDDAIVDKVNNTVSYTTTHFSTYLLVDRTLWFKTWRESLDAMAKARSNYCASLPIPYFDFVYAIQGNMPSANVDMALQLSSNFNKSMYTGDRCAALYFGEKVGMYRTLENKTNANSVITTMRYFMQNAPNDPLMIDIKNDVGCLNHAVCGSNYIYYNNIASTNQKAVIIYSDGRNIATTGGDVEWDLKDYDPIVYVVRIGNYAGSDSILEAFAKKHGGGLLVAESTQDVFSLFYEAAKTKLYEQENTKDTDKDGVSDIIEFSGILLSNGRVVYTDPKVADSDGDSLSDGAEIGSPVSVSSLQQSEKILLSQAGSQADTTYMYCFKYSSNPKVKDTDGDMYVDSADPRPRTSDVEIINLRNQTVSQKGYISVTDTTDGSISYGGSQMWFDGTDFMGNMQNYLIHYFGCGLIAFNDFMQYRNNIMSLEKTDYMNRVRTANISLPIVGTGLTGGNDFRYGIGANGLSIIYSINVQSATQGDSILATWEWTQTDEEQLSMIKNMISNDIPVILSMGPRLTFDANASNGVIFNKITVPSAPYQGYTFKDSGEGSVKAHYVTVTGVLIDKISSNIMLRISSWGSEYYINYAEYRNYCIESNSGIASGLVNIQSIA